MLFSALAFGCIHFSPALSSVFLVSSFVMGLADILLTPKRPLTNLVFIWIFALLVLFQIGINLLFHNTGQDWQGKWMVKLPLLLAPLLAHWTWNRNQIIAWLLAIALPLCWVSLASVGHYLANVEFYNQMVLESKPIPIFSQVYHIEFSVILGIFSFLSLLVTYLFRKEAKSTWYWILLVVAIVNSLNLHVLSARTGIMAFWAAVFVSFMATRPWQYFGLKKTVLASVILLIGIFMVPSIRHRLANSADDIRTITTGGDLNDKSFGRRWLAWDAAISAIGSEPWRGHGLQNVQPAMDRAYFEKKSTLEALNRIPPHNQYLEIAIQSGLFALVLLLIGIFSTIFSAYKSNNVPLLAFAAAFCIAMLVESLLERQAGVLVVAVLLPFLANWRIFAKDP